MVFFCFLTITTFDFIFSGMTGGGEQPLDVSDGSPPPLQVEVRFEVSPTASKFQKGGLN